MSAEPRSINLGPGGLGETSVRRLGDGRQGYATPSRRRAGHPTVAP